MSNPNFKNYLTSNLNLEDKDIAAVLEHCQVKEVKKDQFLLRQNERCKNTFFVENGLLRQYAVDSKGKEHTISFAPENWLVSDRESLYFDKPSAYSIQALEDSKVVIMDEEFMELLSEKIPSFVEFNNKLLHHHIRHLQERIKQLLSATAEERYVDFIEMYPDILQRVSQTMIASYLGITPESLSRVRKELAKKYYKKYIILPEIRSRG